MVNNTIDFSAFSKHRLALIEALETGKLDKCQYIKASLNFYDGIELTEPETINSIEQGLYYYQYYNSLAKCHQMKFRELIPIDLFQALEHRELSSNYYTIKDRITRSMLKLLKREQVLAYYLKTDSSTLNQKLVEIILLEEEKVVLHTLNKKLIRYLDHRGWLSGQRKVSVIETYINQPYYEI